MEVRKTRVSSKVLAAHDPFNSEGATAGQPLSTRDLPRVPSRSLASGDGGERAVMQAQQHKVIPLTQAGRCSREITTYHAEAQTPRPLAIPLAAKERSLAMRKDAHGVLH